MPKNKKDVSNRLTFFSIFNFKIQCRFRCLGAAIIFVGGRRFEIEFKFQLHLFLSLFVTIYYDNAFLFLYCLLLTFFVFRQNLFNIATLYSFCILVDFLKTGLVDTVQYARFCHECSWLNPTVIVKIAEIYMF